MIKVNGKVQTCHRCGSNDLSIINYDNTEKTCIVWCMCCDEQTMEDALKLYKIKEIKDIDIWMD